MMKRQFIITFTLLFLAGISLAQLLSPSVVSTSGGFFSNSSGMLSFTVGEMAAIETYTNSTILTQGFQQAWDFGTAVYEQPELDFSFAIYPNPTDGIFKLVTQSYLHEHISVRILDVLGREIRQSGFDQESDIHIEYFDLSHAAQGVYLFALSVQGNNTSGVEYHFIRKIQVVR